MAAVLQLQCAGVLPQAACGRLHSFEGLTLPSGIMFQAASSVRLAVPSVSPLRALLPWAGSTLQQAEGQVGAAAWHTRSCRGGGAAASASCGMTGTLQHTRPHQMSRTLMVPMLKYVPVGLETAGPGPAGWASSERRWSGGGQGGSAGGRDASAAPVL